MAIFFSLESHLELVENYALYGRLINDIQF